MNIIFLISAIIGGDLFKIALGLCFLGFGFYMLFENKYKWKFYLIYPKVLVFVGCIIITLAIPVVIHKFYFQKNEIREQLVITFYGSYISFLGTTTLGYIVYLTDKVRRNETKYSSCMKLKIMFDNISRDIQCLKKNINIKRIEYDENWITNFVDFSYLYKNSYYTDLLKEKLIYFLNVIYIMNNLIENQQTQKAIDVYTKFIKEEEYDAYAYNYLDLERIIKRTSNGKIDEKEIFPWFENRKTKKMIHVYAEQYGVFIENWIYNYLLKNHKQNIKLEVINSDLVNWLLLNDTIKKDIISPFDKRILTKAINTACTKFTRLQFVWGELSIK